MRSAFRRAVAALAWVAVAGALAAGCWEAARRADALLTRPAAGPAAGPVVIEVPAGLGARAIATRLAAEGVLDQPLVFLAWVRASGQAGRLQAGEYRVERPLSVLELADLLVSGRVVLHEVTVPEGLDRFEAAALLASQGPWSEEDLLAAFADPAPIASLDPLATDLEGYLAPETYRFPRTARPRDVAAAMVGRFRSWWEELDGSARAAALGRTPREIVTLASLVEEETALPQERRLVASVFHNRLARGMKMECDPTVIHALKLAGAWHGGALRRSDLAYPSPYNTYVAPGLPPGPIASPGRASLEAALDPAQSALLFFVASGSGGHRFAETAAQHARNVARWRQAQAEQASRPAAPAPAATARSAGESGTGPGAP